MTAPKQTPALCLSGRSSKQSPILHQTFILATILLLVVFALPCRICLAYSDGNGTRENPYQIANVADLLYLGSDEPNYNKFFILTADINLAGYNFNNAVIAPGDDYSPAFAGSFDGAGHKISNLTINAGENSSGLGLFGHTIFAYLDDYGYYWSEIKNITLENIRITTTSGSAGGLVADNEGVPITNCHSTGSIGGFYMEEYSGGFLGGLVAYNRYGIISNCSSDGVLATSSAIHRVTGWPLAGGLVAYNEVGVITNSHSDCNLIADGNFSSIGGLVGRNTIEYSTPGNIINCYSTGTITGYNAQTLSGVGGLVGGNEGTISKCFSTIPMIIYGASSEIGGLVGSNYGDINDCYATGPVTGPVSENWPGLGGLVGYNAGVLATIRNCYSVGEVTPLGGSGYVGGLVGAQYESSIINSYFLNTSGPDNSLGEPLTDAQMKQQANFVGWDFLGEIINGTDDIWWIHENVTYPKLAWCRVDTPSQILYPIYDPDCNLPIYWSAAEGATSYELDRSNNGGSTWMNVYVGTATFKVETVVPGLYRYRVRGINSGAPGDYLTCPNDCNAILSTCFPDTNATNLAQWKLVGRPDCWCAPPKGSGYQCDGDADGTTSGPGYRVYAGDLTILSNNWKKVASVLTSDPNIGPTTRVGACADFDHKANVISYRIYTADLTILTNNWKKKNSSWTGTDKLPGNCPR